MSHESTEPIETSYQVIEEVFQVHSGSYSWVENTILNLTWFSLVNSPCSDPDPEKQKNLLMERHPSYHRLLLLPT